MYDLISEYENTLKKTRALKRSIESEIENYMIIATDDRKNDEKRFDAKEKIRSLRQEKSIIAGMESDLVFAIDWMVSARHPGNRRGIERRSSFQRTKLLDPYILATYHKCYDSYSWDEDQDQDKLELDIEKALSVLSEKEKEVYIMSRAHSLSYDRIAQILSIKKGTVQDRMKRAERKLGEYISGLEGAG